MVASRRENACGEDRQVSDHEGEEPEPHPAFDDREDPAGTGGGRHVPETEREERRPGEIKARRGIPMIPAGSVRREPRPQ